MDIGSDVFLVSLVVLVLMFAVFGPPVWWYWHGRKPGEKREKKWGAILVGSLVLILPGYVRPTVKGDWIGWTANIGLIVCGAWLIAFGAKGSRVN